tara:strand:- start:137 stop:400 length:264 start_codon:yes stop_codon:yes gene_type:complete
MNFIENNNCLFGCVSASGKYGIYLTRGQIIATIVLVVIIVLFYTKKKKVRNILNVTMMILVLQLVSNFVITFLKLNHHGLSVDVFVF